jgi:hypothetical protein
MREHASIKFLKILRSTVHCHDVSDGMVGLLF